MKLLYGELNAERIIYLNYIQNFISNLKENTVHVR